ncbi:hypothetical protein RJ639_007865 [Escallonia herrerae]|uniref:Uncharacterized protein n=1 Tax=Escallonia herrerae TaxID=1293975 RepID=A0AA88VXD0_9ASTE|nr:hypothetical protein RJ639_007865 [Escallonia herrerae]
MSHGLRRLLLSLAILLLAISAQNSEARLTHENGVKSAVFLSPKFVLRSGSVANKFYHDINFPRGHIAIKSFTAEVVDEAGNPVPLHETYLHHWVVESDDSGFYQSDIIIVKNSGMCDRGAPQYFGLGSETRKTNTHVPDPYGIEVGDPAETPAGYKEKWLLNVHAIDTRGAEDRLGCTECKCDLYNVTVDEFGRPLGPDYIGGLRCCYDEMQCRLRKGFASATRSLLYVRYAVKWADNWDNSIVPVKIYIFDVTDTWKRSDGSKRLSTGHNCQDFSLADALRIMAGTRDGSDKMRMDAAREADLDDAIFNNMYNMRETRGWCIAASCCFQMCADEYGIESRACRYYKKIWSECKAKNIAGTRDIIVKECQQ